MKVNLDNHMVMSELFQRLILSGTVRNREDLDSFEEFGRDCMGNSRNYGECGIYLFQSRAYVIAVGAVFVESADESEVSALDNSRVFKSVKDVFGVVSDLRKTASFKICDVFYVRIGAGLADCGQNIGKHVCRLFFGVKYDNAFFAFRYKLKESFCDDMLEVAAIRPDIGLICRASGSFHLICGTEEDFLAFQFSLVYPSRFRGRLKSRDDAVDVLPESGVDVDRDCGCGYARIVYCRLNILPYYHGHAGSDDGNASGFELFFGVSQHFYEYVVTAEDELVIGKGCCEHSQTVVFEETCVFERASRRSVQDCQIDTQISYRVESRNYRTRSRLYVFHYITSMFLH